MRLIDRQTAISRLIPGDLFYARNPHNSTGLIAITTAITPKSIEARHLGTQDEHRFDRQTGQEHRGYAVIESIAPLPIGLHESLQSLDRHAPLPNLDRLPHARTRPGHPRRSPHHLRRKPPPKPQLHPAAQRPEVQPSAQRP